MARLLVPTRNRPTSLASVIAFLERFYPGTEVIVADGSSEHFADANERAMTDPGRAVRIEYRRYPYELPLFDRLLDVLGSIDDPLVIMASDDDFPLMENLAKAEALIEERPEAVTAMGAKLSINLMGPGEFAASLRVSRSIAAPAPVQRCQNFTRWPFSTTYSVTRRTHLIERFERARQVFFTGFYDFGVGLHDAARGEIITVPEFGFVITRHYAQSSSRPEGPLDFIHRADELLTMIGFLARDLEETAGLERAEAQAVAEDIYHRKIAGGRAATRRGFEDSPVFRNFEVQSEVQAFETVFSPSAPARETYGARLRVIVDAMNAAVSSSDDAGEALTAPTFDRQMQGESEEGSVTQQQPPSGPAPPRRAAPVSTVIRSTSCAGSIRRPSSGATRRRILSTSSSSASRSGGCRRRSRKSAPFW